MNLILFIPQDTSSKGETFKKVIDQNFKRIEIQTLRSLNSLNSRLKKISIHEEDIYILFIETKKNLIDLTSLTDLMNDKCIILILPDDSKQMTSMGLKFFPRYFTYMSDTYSDLIAVVTKLISKKKININ